MDPAFAALLGLMPIADYEREQELRRPLSADEDQLVDEALRNVWGMLGSLNRAISTTGDTDWDHVPIDDQDEENIDAEQLEDMDVSENTPNNAFDDIAGLPMSMDLDVAVVKSVPELDQSLLVEQRENINVLGSSDSTLENVFDDIVPMNMNIDEAAVSFSDLDRLLGATAEWADMDIASYLKDWEQVEEIPYVPSVRMC